MMESTLTLEVTDLTKNYGRKKALRLVTLSVHKGQILCILGPSGSGKSTLLRLIAGLEQPNSGNILIKGNNQKGVSPQQRDVGFVFQTTEAIFPHKTVHQNISFPLELKIRKGKTKDLLSEVNKMVDIVGLTPYVKQYPEKLSGGEQQRISIARALIYKPSLLLLDEPLSSLDNILKRELMDRILEIRTRFQPTIIYVTHDEREALELADTIAIMNEGSILQLDNPEKVSSDPSTTKVAEIIGGWNIFEADFFRIGSQCHLQVGLIRVEVDRDNIHTPKVDVGIPVSAFELVHGGPATSGSEFACFSATIGRVVPRGATGYLVSVMSGNTLLRFETKTPVRVSDQKTQITLRVAKSAIKLWQKK